MPLKAKSALTAIYTQGKNLDRRARRRVGRDGRV